MSGPGWEWGLGDTLSVPVGVCGEGIGAGVRCPLGRSLGVVLDVSEEGAGVGVGVHEEGTIIRGAAMGKEGVSVWWSPGKEQRSL